MTLRARIAASAGLAVAIAVLIAAISLYVAVRSDLRSEVDRSLTQRAQAFVPGATGSGSRGASRNEGSPPPRFSPSEEALPGGEGPPPGQDGDGFPSNVQPAPLGGPSGYIQFVAPSAPGQTVRPSGVGELWLLGTGRPSASLLSLQVI